MGGYRVHLFEMNMNGEVPALIDADATATFEVDAILRYYATRPPVGTCWQKAPAATANVVNRPNRQKLILPAILFSMYFGLSRVFRRRFVIMRPLPGARADRKRAGDSRQRFRRPKPISSEMISALADIQLGDRWYGYSGIDVVSRFVAFAGLSQQVANKVGLFALCVGVV